MSKRLYITRTHTSVNIFISARKSGISPDKSLSDKSLSIVEKKKKGFYKILKSVFMLYTVRYLQFPQLY